MPRKAKEKNNEIDLIDEKEKKDIKKSSKKSTTAKTSTKTKKKESSLKKDTTTAKKKTSSTSSKKDSSNTAKKKTSSTSSKKDYTTTDKKKTSSTSSKKDSSTTTKKKTSKSVKKETSQTKKIVKPKEPIQIIEYYDLPYKYGNTLVKLLAQTPKTLFVYWEISDLDIKNFKEQYGNNFFNETKPMLIVHNLTLNKTTEVEINDFANCWYLNIEDADCTYDIELARKFIKNKSNSTIDNTTTYLHIAKSNNLQSPNDHILFEKLSNFITFTDTSTGENIKKNIKSFNFLKDLYKFYQDMYNDEILKNPSSNFNF